MAVRVCLVAIRDGHHVLHGVEVRASSLFEAAVRGLVIIRDHPRLGTVVNRATVLEIHTAPGALAGRVRVDQLLRWLDSAARSPADRVRRYQLKQLLIGEPRGRVNQRERYH